MILIRASEPKPETSMVPPGVKQPERLMTSRPPTTHGKAPRSLLDEAEGVDDVEGSSRVVGPGVGSFPTYLTFRTVCPLAASSETRPETLAPVGPVPVTMVLSRTMVRSGPIVKKATGAEWPPNSYTALAESNRSRDSARTRACTSRSIRAWSVT